MSKTIRNNDTPATAGETSLSEFFSAAEARNDRWRRLNRIAKALAGADAAAVEGLRKEAGAVLAELVPLEELNGYPGPALMAEVHERVKSAQWPELARLVQRISMALLSASYRDDSDAWMSEENGEARLPDLLPPSVRRGQARKPYFEILLVSARERATWPALR